MSRHQHQKELPIQKKVIIYVLSALLAVTAAIGLTFLIIHLVKNPPAIFYSNNTSYISSYSDYDEFLVPEATIILTEDGKKEKIEKIVEVSEQVKSTRKNKIIVQNYEVDKSGLSKTKVKIPVKYLPQNPELPTGCEITALTTVLNYYGYDITKTDMADKYLEQTIDQLGDFWEVFVGNPRENGFGCYAKPIAKAANKYLADNNKAFNAVDYSGAAFEDLLKLVENGQPVIIWSTMYGNTEKTLREPYTTIQWDINGKDLQWIAPEHCMVLIGYDLDRDVAIVSDPQRGIVEYDLDTVKARYIALHSQCVYLEPIPLISGVVDGQTYYTTQCVSVSTHNLSSVTLNGEVVENMFLIPGNTTATHSIVITDLDGNETKITVYTKPVLSLLDSLNGTNENNATEDDLETIIAIKEIAQNSQSRYSPYSESRTIKDVIVGCELMIEKINQAKKDFDTIQTAAKGLFSRELTHLDVAEITKLHEDILSLLSNQNLSKTQKSELTAIRNQCQQQLQSLQS